MGSLLRKLPAGITITPIYNLNAVEAKVRSTDIVSPYEQQTQAKCGDLHSPAAVEDDENNSYGGVDIEELEEYFSDTPEFSTSSFEDLSSSSSNVSNYNGKIHGICPHCDDPISQEELPSHLKEHVITNTINYGELKSRILQEKGITDKFALVEEEPNRIEESRRSSGLYSCYECPLVFTRALDLESHLLSHEPDGSFRCKICLKSFRKLSVLQKHERIHNGTAPHSCPLCSKTFNQRVHLKAHLRRHNGDKPYKCGRCPKEYSDSSSLAYHMRTHTGEKPYKCPYCPKGFLKACVLKGHITTHLRGTKAFNGNSIGSRSDNLNGNEEFHDTDKDLQPLLPKFTSHASRKHRETFEVATSISKREQTDVECKDFICTICYKLFSEMANLRIHQLSQHTKKKTPPLTTAVKELNFICARCSQKFPDIASLTKHKQEVHS